MTDTCTISRSTGESVLNPETGQLEPQMETVYPTPDYPDGKCKFQSAGAGSTPEAGGFQYTVVRNECHVPFGSVAVKEDDVVTCTGSANPQLIDKTFRVTGFAVESYATASRIPVESAV